MSRRSFIGATFLVDCCCIMARHLNFLIRKLFFLSIWNHWYLFYKLVYVACTVYSFSCEGLAVWLACYIIQISPRQQGIGQSSGSTRRVFKFPKIHPICTDREQFRKITEPSHHTHSYRCFNHFHLILSFLAFPWKTCSTFWNENEVITRLRGK